MYNFEKEEFERTVVEVILAVRVLAKGIIRYKTV
jgi:hypothetical protein